MKTLVLSPRYTPDSIALRNAALEMGWRVERLPTWRPPLDLQNAEPVPYGEPLFAAVIADSLQLALIEPRLSWVADIPADLRKREIQFTDLPTAREQKKQTFIKPADDKCFAAKIYPSGADLPSEKVLPGPIPVLMSEPVCWDTEYRCFVLEGQVVSLSVYSRKGELAELDDGSWPASAAELDAARDFCRSVLQDNRVKFPPAGVLDVGVIEGRGWAVVEANACWGSGIYGCDPHGVLETLSRASQKKATLSETDRPWIVERSPG
jgi:hypothetical protein